MASSNEDGKPPKGGYYEDEDEDDSLPTDAKPARKPAKQKKSTSKAVELTAESIQAMDIDELSAVIDNEDLEVDFESANSDSELATMVIGALGLDDSGSAESEEEAEPAAEPVSARDKMRARLAAMKK